MDRANDVELANIYYSVYDIRTIGHRFHVHRYGSSVITSLYMHSDAYAISRALRARRNVDIIQQCPVITVCIQNGDSLHQVA